MGNPCSRVDAYALSPNDVLRRCMVLDNLTLVECNK